LHVLNKRNNLNTNFL